jgi:sulfotransferase family protein
VKPQRRPGFPPEIPDCPAGWSIGPPDFVGIGAARAGTTWWFSLLTAHPDVVDVPTERKELHFFDQFWDGSFEPQDRERYHQYFPRAPGTLAGEWTPRYMLDAWVPRLLKAAAPEARLLVMLRDPVARYRSQLSIAVSRRGVEDPAGAPMAQDALARGMYLTQLERVLRHFPREQILMLQFERCIADPEPELRRTYEFIGLERTDFVPAAVGERVNPGAPPFELQPDVVDDMTITLANEVRGLVELFPEIDPGLWPSVRALL